MPNARIAYDEGEAQRKTMTNEEVAYVAGASGERRLTLS